MATVYLQSNINSSFNIYLNDILFPDGSYIARNAFAKILLEQLDIYNMTIQNFRIELKDIRNELNSLVNTFISSGSNFTTAYNNLVNNIPKFIPKLNNVSEYSVTSTFIDSVVTQLQTVPSLNTNDYLLASLDITDVNNIDKRSLGDTFIVNFSYEILHGTLQNIIKTYDEIPEIKIATELSVLIYNSNAYKTAINTSNFYQYKTDLLKYYNDLINTSKVDSLGTKFTTELSKAYLDSSGNVDSSRLLSSLSSPNQTKIMNTQKIINIIINNTINEMKKCSDSFNLQGLKLTGKLLS